MIQEILLLKGSAFWLFLGKLLTRKIYDIENVDIEKNASTIGGHHDYYRYKADIRVRATKLSREPLNYNR